MERYRRQFLQAFPEAANLERSLRSASNSTPFFFFQPATDQDIRQSWLVLARLGKPIGSTFNIRSEVLILFTPFEDLQRRTFNALIQRARVAIALHQQEAFGTERFTPDPNLALLWSPDSAMAEKLETWNSETVRSLVAPVPDPGRPPVELEKHFRKALASVLSARDLYRGLDPVTGDDFVGRAEILKRLSAELRSGQSIGLFGLRRSGKTSVIRELQRRARASHLLVVMTDLESVDDLTEMPRQLSEDLTDALRSMREEDGSTWIGPEDAQLVDGFSELSTRLKRVAEKNPHLALAVAVDEMESLSRFITTDPGQVRTFLGSLRKASQATNNISLLFTGITTRFFDESMLAPGIDNPLFGFVEDMYLGTFTRHETQHLLEKLGRRMLLDWTEEAAVLVYHRTGGYPIFVRGLASAIRSEILATGEHDAGGNFVVAEGSAAEVSRTWGETAARRWAEIVRALENHHETMAEMLRCDEQGLKEWLSLGAEADTAARTLENLGLLVKRGEAFIPSDSLQALQVLGRSAASTIDDVGAARTRRSGYVPRLPRKRGRTWSSSRRVESICIQARRTMRWSPQSPKLSPHS